MYFGQSINEWVMTIHTAMSKKYEMPRFRIKVGDYGFDSYTSVLTAILSEATTDDILSSMRGTLDMSKFVESAHRAWCKNYIEYKNANPSELGDNPRKSLITHDRNNRATAYAANLNEADQGLYRDVIVEVFDILSRKILEAGLQNLSLS